MISKRYLTILGLFLLSIIFGYMIYNSYVNPKFHSEDDLKQIKPGYGIVGDSEFELESVWYQTSMSGNSINFKFNGSPTKNAVFMKIYQYSNKSEYDSAFTSTSQKASAWRIVSTGTETMENLNVKTITIARIDNTEITSYYFFEKDNKYYEIFIDVAGYKDSIQYFNENKDVFNKTINRIIKTIH